MKNARVIIDESTPMPSAEKLARIKELWAQQRAQDEDDGRNRVVILSTGETSNDNDKEYCLTDPFDFKLKPVTMAVHQALAFYEVWNQINKEARNAN